MQHRSLAKVFFLPLVTLGIYSLVWFVRSKNEMNSEGAQIPTAWLIIIPFVSWFWLWRFSEGVETVTRKDMGTGAAFCLLFFLSIIGMVIVQDKLNKVAKQ